jgi:hypothetical protein
VIPSDDNDEPVNDAMLTMTAKPRKVGRKMTFDKTTSVSKTESGMAAKLRVGAASDKESGVATRGMPTGAPLTMDDDNEYVNNTRAARTARPTARMMALVDGVASIRHRDPLQAAQFKDGGHEWEGSRTPRKKA